MFHPQCGTTPGTFLLLQRGANYFSGENRTDVYQHTEHMQRVFEVKNSGGTTMTVIIFFISAVAANFCLGKCTSPQNFILEFSHALPIKIRERRNVYRHLEKSSRHTVASACQVQYKNITTPYALFPSSMFFQD